MVAKLAPGPHFKQFFKRADAARQGHKGIAALGHHRLALVHVLHDVQFIAGTVGQFLVYQRLGNHAHYATAGKARGLCHGSHEPAASAAVHQLT